MRKNTGKIFVVAVLIVVAAFLFSEKQGLFRLALNVPEEGVSYDFNDGTFQGWIATDSHISIVSGRVKASASESGGGTQTYSYSFDTGFEGWTVLGDAGGYGKGWTTKVDWGWTAEIQSNHLYLRAYAIDGLNSGWGTYAWAYSFVRKEFDFTKIETVKVSFQYTCVKDGVLRVYKSVGGNVGELLDSRSITPSSVWVETIVDLSESAAGKTVFLYIGVDCPPNTASSTQSNDKQLNIDNLKVSATQPVFTAEGYIEQEFSFTKGFTGATVKAVNIEVDYASEAEWTGFWGVKIIEGSTLLASWQFTKGYLAWNTFRQDIRSLVAGKTVKIRIGGVVSSAASWYLDNVKVAYVLEYPFLTVQFADSYPANSWVNVTAIVGGKQSGVLFTAEVQDRGFQAVSDQNGAATIKVQTPAAGSYPIKVFATNPSDGQRYTVQGTLNVLPRLQASILAEPTQHYDAPITFTVKTFDPDRNLPVDADTLKVQVLKDDVKADAVTQRLATGEYLVSFTATAEGTAQVTVTPEKAGYYPKPETCEITLLKPKIVVTVNLPQQVKAGGEAQVHIKTTTPDGKTIDADTITVYVTDPDGKRTSHTPSRITRGTYLQTLSFPVKGVYRIEVQAACGVYGSTSSTYTVTAEVQDVFGIFGTNPILLAGITAVVVVAAVITLRRKWK